MKLGSDDTRKFPHWETPDGSILLVCGDSLEILPTLEAGSVDFVITDPPWISRRSSITRRSGGVASTIDPSLGMAYGSIGEFSAKAISLAFGVCRHDMMVICGYREIGQVIAALEPIRGIFIWHKPNGGISVIYPSPLDVAYIVWSAHTSKITGFQHWKSQVMSHSVPTAGCISNGERLLERPRGKAAHPAQGPISLYMQLMTPMRGSILDPYMGTGTSGVAAIRHGLPFIGIERDQRYFDMATRRIQGELEKVKADLFKDVAPAKEAKITQEYIDFES